LNKARELPKEGSKTEVERYLTGKETEPWEISTSNFTRTSYRWGSRLWKPTALMLGSDSEV
jgi:hypothetical protein